MQLKYIDTHCHYESVRFNKNRGEILEKVRGCCEKIICVGTNAEENKRVMDICKEDFVYGMVGYFPTSVYQLDDLLCKESIKNFSDLTKQLRSSKCVGLGEIGLDYHWDSVGDSKGEEARKLQQKWFIHQARLAIMYDLPVSIHSRDAEEDTVKILGDLNGLKGVVHCFAYSPETARYCVDKGLYLGIGGTSTYKNNEHIRQVIKETPIECLLLETDAPYLSPEPVRRQMNDSTNIKYVVENIAAIKGMTYEDVVKETNKNAYELYKF